VNAHRRGLTGRRATVQVDGGELAIEWREDGPWDGPRGDPEVYTGGTASRTPRGNAGGNHVLMTGPVATAFTGEIELEAFPA